jgi:Zn-dependent peptidase ImmA (M78 family)
LVAFRGQGAIFVDGTDPADETRLTIAHETGHFLADYADLRSAAIKSFGESIAAVLDGERQASSAERVTAMLRRVPIGVHTHLARRENANWAVLEETESRADQLAIELLAPSRPLRTKVRRYAGKPRDEAIAGFGRWLARRFGVPVEVALQLAAARLPIDTRPSFLRALRAGVELSSPAGNKRIDGQAAGQR